MRPARLEQATATRRWRRRPRSAPRSGRGPRAPRPRRPGARRPAAARRGDRSAGSRRPHWPRPGARRPPRGPARAGRPGPPQAAAHGRTSLPGDQAVVPRPSRHSSTPMGSPRSSSVTRSQRWPCRRRRHTVASLAGDPKCAATRRPQQSTIVAPLACSTASRGLGCAVVERLIGLPRLPTVTHPVKPAAAGTLSRDGSDRHGGRFRGARRTRAHPRRLLRLFSQQGVQAVGIDAIITRSGVAPADPLPALRLQGGPRARVPRAA